MNQFLSNKIIAGIVALALLVGVGVLVSSGDTSSTTRNAALVVATPCPKPGQVTKVSKQSVVCATTNAGSLWYATMKAKGKAQACKSPGAIREKSNIVWVCGVIKKKKLWQATQPLSALAAKEDLPSTTPATPDAPLNVDNADLAEPAAIDTAATQTLALAKPAALSLETQPLGGVNALALATQPVVQLLDQGRAPISTAGITITAVSGRTDVVLSGNTAVTDATGRAIFKTLSLTGIMGDIALTFTAPRLEGITSGNLVLAAGVATKLVSDTTLEAVATGKAFDQQPVLHLEDLSGNVIAISERDVVVSSSPPGLYGYLTLETAKDGYVRFTDLTLTQIGETKLTFASGTLSTTSTVNVVPGDAQALKITTEASEVATNDTKFLESPVVQLIDAEDNNVTTAGVTVTARITQFPTGDTNHTARLFVSTALTNAQGVATFDGLGIKGLTGEYKLGFTSAGGVTKVSDKTVTLKFGGVTQLKVLTAPSSPEGNSTAGTWSLTQSPVIGLRDISNNPVTTSGVIVTATVDGQAPTTAPTTALTTALTDTLGKATIELIFSGDNAGDRMITYKASNVNNLTAAINLTVDLPRLIPEVQDRLAYPSTPFTTTSSFFALERLPKSNSTTGVWIYTSSNPLIATVDSAGKVTQNEVAGEVTITATQAETTKYAGGATSSKTLTIVRTPTEKNQDIAYPLGPFTTTSSFFALERLPKSNSTTGVWIYTSSNPLIATVDSAGKVTQNEVAGEVTITATQAETTKYAGGATSSKTLTIVRTSPTIERNVSYDFAINTYSFNPTKLPKSNSDGAWTYSSSSEARAPVNATTGTVIPGNVGGTVTITAIQAETPKYAGGATSTYTGTYKTIIGKTGPGGGKVFYAAEALQPWGRYLEAAPNDYQVNGLRTPVKWGCEIYPLYSSSWSIGSGRVNTDRILAGCNNRDAAADVAKKYSTTNTPCAPGAAGQWFLPSSEELRQLVANKTAIGGFGDNDSYVSSTQDYYWPLLGTTYRDDIGSRYINSYFYVRPVRAFGPTSEFNGVCAIGADGPGGGKVFYVHPWGTFTSTGSNCGSNCRYLEVAPYVERSYFREPSGVSEIAAVAWCSQWPSTRLGVTATGIGSGMTNTINARKTCTSGAIQVAADYNNGKDDWYLPSKDELYEMWRRRAVIGFAADYYWSSSEFNEENAWGQYFYNGDQDSSWKFDTYYVRPVRAF